MIRIRDSFLLANTKLKSRRFRTYLTIIIPGILFIGLTSISLTVAGALQSFEHFTKNSFTGRYIVNVNQISYYLGDAVFNSDPGFVEQAKLADEKIKSDKAAEATRLGISYDPKSEISSYAQNLDNPQQRSSVIENFQTHELFEQKRKETSKKFIDDLDNIAKEFAVKAKSSIINIFGGQKSFSNQYLPGGDQNLSLIIGDKEFINEDTKLTYTNYDEHTGQGISSITSSLSVADQNLLEDFLLENQSFEINADGALPVIAPFSAAEEALGYTKLPDSASPAAKLDRIKEVRGKSAGTIIQTCMRNSTSLERQNQATQQAKDIDILKKQTSYVLPDLVQSLSSIPCQDVITTRDIRSNSDVFLSQKQQEFDTKFGKPAPTQRLLKFKIVGISPDFQSNNSAGFSFKSFIYSFLSSGLSSSDLKWFMPKSVESSLPELAPLFKNSDQISGYSIQLVEFSNLEEIKKFIKQKDCKIEGFYADGSNYVDVGKINRKKCEDQGTPFSVQSFGNNNVALESAKKDFTNIYLKVGLVIGLISTIIMMGTIGKIISDSRRETAVFRALGSKRRDIIQIYLTYSLMLAGILIVFVSFISLVLVFWVHKKYSSSLTIESLLTFSSKDFSNKFSLIGLDIGQILALFVFIISGAVFSTIIPLAFNVRRNPINDMRDDR